MCNLPHIGEPCAGRHEPTAFIHVGRKRDQAETDGKVEVSRNLYIWEIQFLLLELNAEEKITQITDACDRFCRWAYRIMGAVVTAGIGTVCDSLYEISTFL